MTPYQKSPIAIVGMAFRLPGDINTSDALWSVLQTGENLISTMDESRFASKNYLHARKSEPGKSYTFSAGLLSRVDAFDASFFGITPREAQQMDPQQRLLLETTWEALENGGQNIDQLAGADCAVYVGVGSLDHMLRYVNDTSAIDLYTMTGSCASIASNRISYAFDFHGPSMSIDTACSSSLVALHQACSSLWSGEASMAIAGGVNVLLSPTSFVGFAKASMLSPDGQCKSFAADGRGYVRAEGCVVLYLKPLAAALRDGDPIRALILNSGVNSDGRTHGIAFPNAESQAALIARVHHEAGIAADDVDYIEAHGTGTIVGDQCEARALGLALAQKRAKDNPLPIGSIKSNLGHLEVASGLTGVLKTILCLQHQMIPPTRHAENPNPDIPFDELNLKLVDATYVVLKQDKQQIMGINSFGFGGTNAHVILANYVPTCAPEVTYQALPPLQLTARDEKVFPILAKQYLDLLKDHPDKYYDIAYALSHRRALHDKSLVVYGDDQQLILTALESLSEGTMSSRVVSEQRLGHDLPVVLVYSGNGSQWQGMGCQLIHQEPIFIETIAEIDALFMLHADFSIKAELLAPPEASRFDQTEVAQPCIFALQVATTRYLLKQGMRIAAVIGHSVGEIAAAWACGALTLAEATKVIYERSFWQGKTRGQGKMLAVALSQNDAQEMIETHHLSQTVEIAAINSPKGVTFAGDLIAIQLLQTMCKKQGILNRLLDLDYAFHTHHMDSIREGLTASLIPLNPQKNTIPFISTVTGRALAGDALGVDYWWQNIRRPVLFNEAIGALLDDGLSLFVEVGPHPVLKPYIDESIRARDNPGVVIQTFKRHASSMIDLQRATFRTWLSGAAWDKTVYFPHPGRVVSLPPYPFVRESHWLTPSLENANQMDRHSKHPLLGWQMGAYESIWENHLDATTPNYLADHVVDGVVVMPAAGFAEMAIAASTHRYGNQHHVMTDLDILAPLILDEQSSRLVRFELQADTGDFTIKSRIRQTEEPWLLHVVGRMMPQPNLPVAQVTVDLLSMKKGVKQDLTGVELYQGAERHGLVYGPLFQTIESIWLDERKALASLSLKADFTPYLKDHYLYPGHLDACFQVLIGLLAHQNPEHDTVLPVRMGRLQMFFSHPKVHYVTAEIRVKSKQSVLADFEMLDIDGTVVARITGCRFKKVYFSDHSDRVNRYICKPYLLSSRSRPSGIDFKALQKILLDLNIEGSEQENNPFESVIPLIDLLSSRLIYSAVVGLAAGQHSFSMPSFAANASIARDQYAFLRWCLSVLLEDGLIEKNDSERYTLLKQDDALDVNAIWTLILHHYPHYVTELLLLGRVGLHLQEMIRGQLSVQDLLYSPQKNDAFTHFLEDAPSVIGIHPKVCQTMAALIEQLPPLQRIRVLDIGYSVGRLSRELIQLLPEDRTDYCFAVVDNHLQAGLEGCDVVYLTTTNALMELKSRSHEPFDVILIRHQLHDFDSPKETLQQLKMMLAQDGTLLLLERNSCRMHDLILGSEPHWFHEDQQAILWSRLYSANHWQQWLIEAGFQTTVPVFEPGASVGEGTFFLLAQPILESPVVEDRMIPSLDLLIFSETESLLVAAIQAKHETGSLTQTSYSEAYLNRQLHPYLNHPRRLQIIWIMPDVANFSEVSTQCAALVNLAKTLGTLPWEIVPQLIVVTLNALGTVFPDHHQPLSSTVWGVGRVLQNENPALNCKLVDLQGASFARTCTTSSNNLQANPSYALRAPSPHVWGEGNKEGSYSEEMSELLAAHFVEELLQADGENEVILTPSARYGMRIELAPSNQSDNHEQNYRLDFKRAGSLNHLQWFPLPSSPLGVDEVLVRPVASGLNFRDIMYSMGLIPDEAVEDGFLGPTLGMEFAGVVLAVGKDVTDFSVGSRVMGFAPASFSSIAITKAYAITLIPELWRYQDAATIPIAFFTAYYAIHHLARLEAGERILIHGAAGGVGLAAIQVAREIGADIYTTAGSSEKRDFLQLMGIEHRYDSRTLLFADEILADTGGEGVDVIFNCLAGEAITANLSILKPFGRFLELGKRDFYANSKMGLRPFRQNISYFGIDADQLLMKQPALCTRLFQEIMALFAKERFFPLPYREFNTENISEPFRYMQQSRHIGKVIIDLATRPHRHFARPDLPSSLTLSGRASYLVTGGLSGLGLKTALWLVEKGARHLVLVGKTGAVSEEAKEALAFFEATGVVVIVHAMDICDTDAVSLLIATLQASATPLKGVIHAAALYDDALIQNLTAERMESVLAPKVQGAWNLHVSTLDCSLDFFVVYSSVTTMFGNPGQANYVAANTYLEHLISYRRDRHLPGLFAAFGPITDVGYLARNPTLQHRLAAKLGTHVLTSDVALHQLEILMQSDLVGCAIGHLNVSSMQRSLPGLHSPKFKDLLAVEQRFGELGNDQTDPIRMLLVDKSAEEALVLVGDLLCSEISKILRMPIEKIDKKASLLEIGMDSLVGAELGFAIEQRFSIQIPMLALSQGLSVDQISQRILSELHLEDEAPPSHERGLSNMLHEASLHGEALSLEMAEEIMKEVDEQMSDIA
ncbi:MAG: SDR family NAD(P)-dependent oxidoreductase [Legionellales bacterium]|nr:SDR family NAD(P)-dependent oxidoreductase [Legionellales bacterium]